LLLLQRLKHLYMKKIIFAAAILMGCIFTQSAKAQVSFHLNLNIGSQPDWGPVGYEHVSYYYIPDIDAYYDVDSHLYIYLENNIWVHRTYLPVKYRGYNLYSGYKVVINQPNPWLRHTYYRTHYASYRGRRGQAIIRNSHDVRYRNHWQGPVRHETVRPVRPAPSHGPIGHPGHGFPGHGGPEHGNPGHYAPGHGGPGHGGNPGHGGHGGHGGGHRA
jgi:hypothetical protein